MVLSYSHKPHFFLSTWPDAVINVSNGKQIRKYSPRDSFLILQSWRYKVATYCKIHYQLKLTWGCFILMVYTYGYMVMHAYNKGWICHPEYIQYLVKCWALEVGTCSNHSICYKHFNYQNIWHLAGAFKNDNSWQVHLILAHK